MKLMTLRCPRCRTIRRSRVAEDQILCCPCCGSEEWPEVLDYEVRK